MRVKLSFLTMFILLLAIVLTCVLLGQSVLAPHQSNVQKVSLGGQTFYLEKAITKAEQEMGLGGRQELAHDQGMLFVFDEPGAYCFWMKDTLVNLDILWFDKDYRLIHRALNVSPDTYPTSFCPPRDAKYVVEL